MKNGLSVMLIVIGLSSIMVLGSAIAVISPVFGSSSQETAEGENGEQDQPADGGDESETSEQEPADEPEPEPTGGELQTPSDVMQTSEEEQQQEQLALDILTANGLTPLNATNGDGGSGGDGTIEKCAVNSQGQTFCYEPLPTEENCMTPMKVEDPPICSPK